MPLLKNIRCTAQITDYGQLSLTHKGFCYSTTETLPDLTNSDSWFSYSQIDPNGEFQDIITGLTETTLYYISGFAINNLGTGYTTTSDVTTFTSPVVTVNIVNDPPYYEIGSSNSLTVSGITIMNDEVTFINGVVNQTSVPPALLPIISWNGYRANYSVGASFSPASNDINSWNITEKVTVTCGSPAYQVSSTIVKSAVFPYLWVLKSNYILPSSYPTYFNNLQTSVNSPSFYKDCSIATNPSYPTNGKLLDKIGDQTFFMTPLAGYNTLIFGYPAFYGYIQYSINGGPYYTPNSNYWQTLVNTGKYNNMSLWTYSGQNGYPYMIFEYQFSIPSPPTTFSIKFV